MSDVSQEFDWNFPQVFQDAPTCVLDEAVTDGSFDLSQCPEIDTLLEAVQAAEAGNPVSPNVTCSKACTDLFNELGESCRSGLINGVRSSDNEYISMYGNEFFDTCTGIEGAPSLTPDESIPEAGKVPDMAQAPAAGQVSYAITLPTLLVGGVLIAAL
jgi:hypothetical protein